MSKPFWLDDTSPKQLYNELLKTQPSNTTLWEIFEDYTHTYEKPANTTEAWLQQQTDIIHEITTTHLANTNLKQEEVGYLLEAIQEYTYPNNEQDLNYIQTKYKAVAKKIAETLLAPHKLNDATLSTFLDKLEQHLLGPDAYQDLDEDECEDHSSIDEFNYPLLSLACSNTFFGNNDLGELDYEQQESNATQKFEQYKNEISALLMLQPNEDLQIKTIDHHKIDDTHYWEHYDSLLETTPFAYHFEGDFVAWEKNNHVLFLSVDKEDKELPYIISLGGIDLQKYQEILTAFNSLHC